MASYIIITDKTDFSEQLKNKLGECHIIDSKGKSASIIADEICTGSNDIFTIKELDNQKKRIEWVTNIESTTVLLINVEGLYDSFVRNISSGIDILIWLRCKYYLVNPVIFYGFQTTASILHRHPEHLIIHSEGCYYLRLPFNLNKIKSIVVDEVNDLSRIRKHLAAGFNMEVFRHKFANIWGIDRLREAHNAIKDLQPGDSQSISESKEVLIAKFLYLHSKTEDVLDNVLLYNIKSSIETKIDYISKKRILYIDDNASKGWSRIIKEIFNVRESNLLVVDPSNYNNDNLSLSAFILNLILYRKPDCVLLDLRLIPRDDDHLSFGEQYTGAMIAKDIKRKHMSIPVIMFTASNKVENLRIALRAGCETLWTKEGIDEYQGINYSLQNYFRLVDSIYKACKKFDFPDAKINCITEHLLLEIDKRKDNITQGVFSDISFFNTLKNFDLLIPDTNFFINNQNVNDTTIASHISNIYILLILCKYLFSSTFYLHEQVFLELLRFCKMEKSNDGEEVDQDILIERSRYITSKIFKWQSNDLIIFGEYDAEGYGRNMRVDPAADSANVYADEALTMYIPTMINQNKIILLITDDNGLAWHVGEELNNDATLNKSSSRTKIVNEVKGTKEIKETFTKNKTIVYKRMDLSTFHTNFNMIKEKIMKIPVIE